MSALRVKIRQFPIIGVALVVIWALLSSASAAQPIDEEAAETLIQRIKTCQPGEEAGLIVDAERALEELSALPERRYQYGRIASELSRILRYVSDYDKAMIRAQEAIEIGQEFGDPELEALGHNSMGGVYWRRGDYALVWREWLEALRLRELSGNEAGKAATYSNMGILLDEQGDYPGALEYYNRALEIDRRIQSAPGEIAATINNIGTVHEILENPEIALRYYRESLAIREEVGDFRGIATSYTNIGSVLKTLGQFDEARAAFAESYRIRSNSAESSSVASVLAEMGAMEVIAGKLDQAHEFAMQSWEIRNENREPWGVAHSALILADIELERGDPQLALEWFARAHTAASEIGAQLHLLNELKGVAEARAALGEWERAYRVLQQHGVMREEVLGESAQRRIELLEITSETRRRERELGALRETNVKTEADLRETERERRIVIAGTIGLAGFVVVLAWAFRNQRRATRTLELAHQRLQILGQEKDHFLRVVAHDLRSPLGNIRWMSSLLKERRNDPDEVQHTCEMIDEVAGRLVDTTSKMLDINRIEEGEIRPDIQRVDIEELIARVMALYRPMAEKKCQSLSSQNVAEGHGFFVRSDRDLLEQVLDNVLSNAIKFTPLEGEIVIGIARSDSGILVSVEDNGPGVPKDQESELFAKFARISTAPTGGEDSHGLGLAIARGLMRSMKGELTYNSSRGDLAGACFTLHLPAD